MQVRFVKGALFMGAFMLVPYGGTALAQPPPIAPTPSVVAPAAPTTAPVAPAATPVAPAATPSIARAAAPHGAVVVAVTDDAGPAAKALAYEVYREPLLRPSIDEATARALTGAPSSSPAATATPTPAEARIAEITALRGSIATSVTDITTRHLLASLGASLRADLVVAVSLDGGHAVARVLHAGTASFERVELGASVEIAPDGARTFLWPGAATTLRGFLPALPAPPANVEADATQPPIRPPESVKIATKPELSDQRPVYKSPWFWAALGGVAAVGITVFVLSKTTGNSPTTVHVDGSVDP